MNDPDARYKEDKIDQMREELAMEKELIALKQKRVTIKNDYHGSSTSVLVRWYSDGTLLPLLQSQRNRVQMWLCGKHDCNSCGPLGESGPQEAKIEERRSKDGRVIVYVDPNETKAFR